MDVDATASIGVHVHPSGVFPRAEMPSAGAGLAIWFTPVDGWRLIGGKTGSRIEIQGLALSLDLTLDDIELRLRTVGQGAAPGFAVVLAPGEGDSFVAGLLGKLDLSAALDVDLRWSARDGLTVGGSAGLSVTHYLGTRMGPLQLDAIEASAARGDQGGLAAAAVANVTVELGPLIIVFEGVGIDVQLAEAPDGDGNVGPLDVRVGFEPPSVVGIGIDMPVAQGGGFLLVDKENGRYEGVLDVAMAEVGITAIVLVTTQLPDGSDGWSMFASLQAAFTGIPLGFGFTLTGVGGLVGIHRGLDAEAMGEGLRQGVLDSILFPEDPIRDAPRILRDMNTIFPAKQGQFVFGPVMSISWGAASVFELELGVVLQLPTPFSISLLGSFSAVLPDEDEPILVLRVDVVGTLDFSAGTISIDASLRDSRVLALELTGDMAVRASFVHSPGFLISFGGFHPEFEAPDGFPTLRRLGVALDTGDNLRITLGGYFALTTNTLQFGAGYELWAKALGFTAEGGASFDALIQFKPFGFLVTVKLWVTIRGPGVELGVSFRGDLAGPNPWFISGLATFKILGIKVSFEISATIGKERPEPPPKSVFLRTLVLEDLERLEAWAALSPATDGGVLVTEGDGDELRVHPAGYVEIRQRIAPLDIRLDHYGASEIEGPDQFGLRRPTIGSVSLRKTSAPVYDHFATAQFFELDDDERLSAPSFEEMVAGLRMGELPLEAGSERSYVYDHEETYRDPAGAGDDDDRSGGISATPAASLDHARAFVPDVKVPRGAFRVRSQTFVATEVDTGSRSPFTPAEGTSYFDARATLFRDDDRARRVLVPAYEFTLSGDADRE